MSLPYLSKITALRAISVVSVILFHLNFLNFGFLGVDIFFLISGYLVAGIIRKGELTKLEFLLRRVKRILPPLLFMVFTITLFVLLSNGKYEKIFFQDSLLSSIAFYSNFYFLKNIDYWNSNLNSMHFIHLWSTSIEMQFYLIATLMASKIKSNDNIKTWLVGFTILFYLSAYLHNTSHAVWFYTPFSRIWEFYLGVLFFILSEKKYRLFNTVCGNSINASSYVIIAILLSGILNNYLSVIASQLILLLVVGLILLFPTDLKMIMRFVESNIIQRIGLISYGLYLWHQPIIAIVTSNQNVNEQHVLMIYILLIYFFAELSYRLVEKPLQANDYANSELTKKIVKLNAIIFIIIISFTKTKYHKEVILNDQEVNLKNNISYVETSFNKKIMSSFDGGDKRFKILIIGDSYAMDFYNILNEGGFLIPLSSSTYFINMGCQNVPNDLDYDKFILPENKSTCNSILRVGDYELNKKILESDGVLIASKWTDYTSKNLPYLITKLNQIGQKNVIIIGRKEFLMKKDPNNQIYINNKEFAKSTDEYEKITTILRSYNLSNYIDLHEIYCVSHPKFYCPLLTDEGIDISFDGSHLTQNGAKFLAEMLKENVHFKVKWNDFINKKHI